MTNKLASQKNIAIFSLKYDQSDPILSHAFKWANLFQEHFDSILIVATHVGKHVPKDNVNVVELGGGRTRLRIVAIFRLLKVTLYLLRNRKKFSVFYHMNEKVAGLISPLLHFAQMKQALWYAHSKESKSLRIAEKYCDVIYSPTNESFPLLSKKLHAIGHGIDTKEFKAIIEFGKRFENHILFLGRLSRIKNLERLIEATSSINFVNKSEIVVDLAGPIFDRSYYEQIIKLGDHLGVEINYLGVIDPKRVPALLNKYQMVFIGNPNTVDKAGVEAAICGCAVLTEVDTLYRHLDLYSIYGTQNQACKAHLEMQIQEILSRDSRISKEVTKLQKRISQQNNLHDLIRVISARLQ